MSEYGGNEGILQPDVGDPTLPAAAGSAGLGHGATSSRAANQDGVRDAAMVLRRAGLKEAKGVPLTTTVDPDTGVYTFEQYTEEQARLDYVEGNNWPDT
jgi:hypothetical protein